MKKYILAIFLIIVLSTTTNIFADGLEDYGQGRDTCYGTGCGGAGGSGKGTYHIENPDRPGHDMVVHDQYSAYVISEITGDDFKACDLKPRSGPGCEGMPQNNPHVYRDKMSGKCGCPSKPVYKIDGCQVTVSCDLEDDNATLVKIDIPCPTVAGTDPKYPLVKMLSGTLVEWRVGDEYVESPHVLKYTNGSNKEGYGTEVFTDFNLSIVVSSVDTGAKWDLKKAKAIVRNTESHSRNNFEFMFAGGNDYVKVLEPKDIYEAYKNRSDEVQAYLALANKNFGERPWTTYDKFVDAMCKFSAAPTKCSRSLKGTHFEEFKGNFYLGNGNPTILGVYSEVSSHGCHGATVVGDTGQPAFGFTFKSTFCIYMHASWGGYFNYGNTKAIHKGECCVIPVKEHIDLGMVCEGNYYDKDNPRRCWNQVRIQWKCEQWADIWECEDGYNYEGPGQSSEDCKECIDIEGWVDTSGVLHKGPFPISFFQSQPLLINP